jgi:hypothetical protein
MWDGYVYATEINDAASAPFSMSALRLAGHASQAYAAAAVTAQRLAPGSVRPLFVLSVALLGVAIIGFCRLLAIAFPGASLGPERALLAGAFMLQPSMLAAVVQPGLDLPLVPAFVWCAVFLLERRQVGVILAGIALAFTKETGLLLYGSLVGSYAVWTFIQPADDLRQRVTCVLRLAPLAAPVLVFGAYALYRRHTAPVGEPVVWNAGTAMIHQSLLRQLIVPRIDRYLASYLTIVLILNFAWIATAVTAAGGVMFATRLPRVTWRAKWQHVVHSVSSVPGLLVIVTLVTGYLLTRFASYANSRYLLPIMGLRDALFLAALLVLPIAVSARRTVLIVYAAALLVSAVRTVDPLSRAIYGTFRFGNHEMLRMTAIKLECCGPGRDQLSYNLEFTRLESLANAALMEVRPGDSTMIVFPDSTNWFVASRLDRTTSRRTVARVNTVAPLATETDSAALYLFRTRHVAYIALPNGGLEAGRRQLDAAFSVGPERRVRQGGYWLSIYPLTPKTQPAENGAGAAP